MAVLLVAPFSVMHAVALALGVVGVLCSFVDTAFGDCLEPALGDWLEAPNGWSGRP